MGTNKIKSIADIARLAKVSKSTVSRALNDSPLVKPETRERIQAIAREHNFRISAPARSLSTQRSNTIAFVAYAYHKDSYSADLMFGAEIMSGITEGLYTLGYELLVVHVDPRQEGWAQRYLDSGRVDGFILMTSIRKQWHIKNLVEINAPFIAWGVPIPKYRYCTVCGDDFSGGRLATEHLISIGRQRIGFIGGPPEELEVKARQEGYQQALQKNGQDLDPSLLAFGDWTPESGASAMKQLLAQSPDLDGVFVNSDLMAIRAIDVIQAAGKQTPEDIAVVGYDDLTVASFNNLPLTTIRQNIPLAGKLLAQNLIQFINDRVVTNVTIPIELIVRESA
jgi:DNA-binding LacI/PurR family transcriptional regulator